MEKRFPNLAKRSQCTGCLSCEDSCSHSSISHYIDSDGHFYVRVNKQTCVCCGLCEKVCPIVSKMEYDQSEKAEFYAAWDKCDKERMGSASGGAFAAMARYVLNEGGFVIGATIIDNYYIKHIVISDLHDLPKLQGSKYSQSDTSGIYKKTLDLLKENKTVLFSGTGCQIGGLLSFLKLFRYEGMLITIDLICGGVPSKLLLQSFFENEPINARRIVSFRSKENGWKSCGFRYNLKIECEEGKTYSYGNKRNIVTDGYGSQLTNRYSCYDCKFVGINRLSDFTIGDLWGDDSFPNEHNKGLSVIVAHNGQSLDLINKMRDCLYVSPITKDTVIKHNYRISNGRKRMAWLLERRCIVWIFRHFPYSILKKIYAFDYPQYSIWNIYKIYMFILKKVMR